MSRLAHVPESAPASQHPLWLPTNEQLLTRPLEYGIAIDPPNSHEIDDAVYAEVLDEDKNLFLYKVHIADGGLLAGTPHLDRAREKGWSEYYEDGTADSMLPEDVVSLLSLERRAGKTGQPAITVSFIAGEGVPPQDFDVYKSRLICEAMTYKTYARRIRQHFQPNNPVSFDLDAVIFSASRYLGGSQRRSKTYERVIEAEAGKRVPFGTQNAYDMNSLYMMNANIIMARLSLADGLPYIFRNHHMGHFNQPEGSDIRTLYPDSDLFDRHRMAWYSRIPTMHEGVNESVFGHATSPLRRSPDLFNHVNRSAALDKTEPPFDEAFMDEFVRELAAKIKLYKGLGSATIPMPEQVA